MDWKKFFIEYNKLKSMYNNIIFRTHTSIEQYDRKIKNLNQLEKQLLELIKTIPESELTFFGFEMSMFWTGRWLGFEYKGYRYHISRIHLFCFSKTDKNDVWKYISKNSLNPNHNTL